MPQTPRLCWRLNLLSNNGDPDYMKVAEVEFRGTHLGPDLTSSTDVNSFTEGDWRSAYYNPWDNNLATFGNCATTFYPITLGWQFAAPTSINEIVIDNSGISAYRTAFPVEIVIEAADGISGPWDIIATIPAVTDWAAIGDKLVYQILAEDTTAPVITATPPGGTFGASVTVTLSSNEPADIYYTTDGSTPTATSAVYSAPLAISGVTTLKFYAVDSEANASEVQTETYTVIYAPATVPPTQWQNTTPPPSPGSSGQWGSSSGPGEYVPGSLAPIFGLTSYTITLDGSNITNQVASCLINESEGSAFGTCSLELPAGIEISAGQAVVVTVAQVARHYLVEEITAQGPQRSVWCRSSACLLDEPHAVPGNWSGWDDTDSLTAQAIAGKIAGSVTLNWLIPGWTLPPRWDLVGLPVEALQRLASAVGAILQSQPNGSLTVRRRWPIRPPYTSSLIPTTILDRSTTLALSAKYQAGNGYGRITVYGYDPAADLPDMEVEESSPRTGDPVHVRLYWRTATPPDFSTFISDGSAAFDSTGTAVITNEELTFSQGKASTRYPISALNGWRWVGDDQGDIWRLADESQQLALGQPDGRGIALVTYTTTYERWLLTGQTVNKVLFGVDVGEAQVSAKLRFASGGAQAYDLTEPLLSSVESCLAAGAAILDEGRAKLIVSAELPITAAPLLPGAFVEVDDPIAGISGNGKIVSSSIQLASGRSTQTLEVHICQ